MATPNYPDDAQAGATDPAQLGADQSPATTPADDAHDLSTVMANADASPDHDAGPATPQGSDFDQQRQQGAGGPGDTYGAVGRGEGMGRAGYNGDEDRTYDQSNYRGGVGTSGGREDLTDRVFDADQNPFTGGYGGSAPDQPDPAQTQNIGLNSPATAPASPQNKKPD